jgi:O-antigen/teichoic acid export membrane protein
VLNKILNTFGTRLLSAMLNLLITILISQFLGPEGKGEQGIIIATIAYILVFVNLMDIFIFSKE